MTYDIGGQLSRLRRERGMTQAALARALSLRGVEVTNQAVSKWETGAAQISAEQLLHICRILGVEDIGAEFGLEGGLARGLDRAGRRKLAEYADLLRASGLYAPAQQGSGRYIPLYTLSVSAGTGQLLDGSDYENIPVGPEVPPEADYGLRVAGDSMEPLFRDGQTVWVKKQEELSHGELGIFLLDGSAYLKRLYRKGDQLRLISENPAYGDIVVTPGRELRILGRVLPPRG